MMLKTRGSVGAVYHGQAVLQGILRKMVEAWMFQTLYDDAVHTFIYADSPPSRRMMAEQYPPVSTACG